MAGSGFSQGCVRVHANPIAHPASGAKIRKFSFAGSEGVSGKADFINYAQMRNNRAHLNYVPTAPARQGIMGGIRFSFDAAAGSPGANKNAVFLQVNTPAQTQPVKVWRVN